MIPENWGKIFYVRTVTSHDINDGVAIGDLETLRGDV